ncbi:MAG: tRNA lysidine(34) synthetase TilS [Oscillospiraceae bacterium]|nr:tRNA lysidine(34) synthetase TilS [Oscillospiraceae bacterium]
MQNKLLKFIRQEDMVQPGDTVICAVSGGADSVALLFAFYLLKEKLGIRLEAAHFNHHLRGEESDRDEAFVSALCDRYDIPLHIGGGQVTAGKKGLEAAARDARYAFLRTLNGKVATAHTADDNAETILMRLIRGTGLKGLGGIIPVQGQIIRPMLRITRQEVEGFLEEWCLSHIEDSSNKSDDFLRNRIRHHVMPLLAAENPKIAENLSQMALRLRQEEEFLSLQLDSTTLPTVESLKTMPKALRSRYLAAFLERSGVREPEDAHIAQAEALVFSEKPSARAAFPSGVTIARNYDRLEVLTEQEGFEKTALPCPGEVLLPGLRVTCAPAKEVCNAPDAFTVVPQGALYLRSRQSGDALRLSGGSKSLKKLFIDRKIPAALRSQIPVVFDEGGILGVYSIGVNLDRFAAGGDAVTIRFEKRDKGE